MSIPDFQSLMLPTLKALADGSETPVKAIRACVAASEKLTPEDVQEMLSSGRQSVFANRISWAVIHMERAGLLERTCRGVYRLMPEGKHLLSRNSSSINLNRLQGYPSYAEWIRRSPSSDEKDEKVVNEQSSGPKETPDEALSKAAEQLRSALEADVLHRLRNAAPTFLERAVVDLLISMGYGGGDATMGCVTGRSGDGGVDGTIREDALGLDEVYVQAKKYTEGNTVGEGDLRNFAGAIDAAGTTKGVFVTTASFTQRAKDYVRRSPKRIVLIDGAELARLMVRHGVGVRTHVRHEVKRIDQDYFDQEVL